ncbi:MAG: M23 family metallopeptidase [Chitinophagales bacterium]
MITIWRRLQISVGEATSNRLMEGVLIFIFVGSILAAEGQPFSPPLSNPLLLSGNFAEPRKSHFHAGLDMRTLEREGLPIRAAADGYVSRVNISPYGYGNALYITHPNGLTTVYGHLSGFNKVITAAIREQQYARESFAVDLFFKPGELPVKQGEQVALSGNTGGSGGPHLHFEIRDSLERPHNPMLYGYVPNDHIAPTINAVQLYALGASQLNTKPYRLAPVKGQWPKTTIALNADEVGIAVNTFDRMDQTPASFGVYHMVLWVDGKKQFEYRADTLSFAMMRQIISEVDYPVFLREHNRSFHRLFLLPNNRLPLYPVAVNRGIINLSDGMPHLCKITVRDFAGNTSSLSLTLQKQQEATTFKRLAVPETLLRCASDNTFEDGSWRYQIPGNSLSDSIFVHRSSAIDSGRLVVQLGQPTNHLQDYARIGINIAKLPASLQQKALIVWKDERGKWISKGGTIENGKLTAKIRELGFFSWRIDTIAPTVTNINFAEGRSYQKNQMIRFRASDSLSGLGRFRTLIDGHWELTELDGKSGVLTILTNRLAAGMHQLELTVADERGNETIIRGSFSLTD